MTRNRIRLQFSGFEEYAEKIDRLNGDLKSIMTEALVESKKLVTPEIKKRMKKHHRTGVTEDSINESLDVKWDGNVGEIEIGFEFNEGLPSVFLMYGTPRMKKDTALYNSIYGSKIKKQISELQKEIFERELERLGD